MYGQRNESFLEARLLAATILVVASLLLLPLMASGRSKPPPDIDFVRGAGTTVIGHAKLAARGGPSPNVKARGFFKAKGALVGPVEALPFALRGPITCLHVEGNEAGLFYPVRGASPEALEGQGVHIYIEDNGRTRRGDPPDRMGFVGPLPLPEPSECPPLPSQLDTTFEVESGNFTVRDR